MRYRLLLYSGAACALLAFLLLAAFAAVVISIAQHDRGAMEQVEAHLAKHRSELDDAVAAVQAAHPEGSGSVPTESLPLALRAVGIQEARYEALHVTLIVTYNPDTIRGFRVWRGTQDSTFADEPTAIPGVYRFVYCNDYPESATNRPD